MSGKALQQFLSERPDVERVFLCLDADKAGEDACKRLTALLPDTVSMTRIQPGMKDWNDVLVHRAEISNRNYFKSIVLKEPSKPETVKIIRMSDVELTPVEWLWKPYLPFGKLSVLQGNPGEGKTYFAMHLAAACTNGKLLPNMERMEPFNVISVSYTHLDAFEIIAVRNLCPVHQNIVPVLHAGLDAGHAHGVRQQPRQPIAGILSGFVGIQTEEHTFHVRAFRKKLLQCLCRHAAQCQITVLLPVFREQLDEGQQVDGGFKDQQLFAGATMGKAKRLFCTCCILPKLLLNPTAACVAGMPVCIPPHKDHVVAVSYTHLDVYKRQSQRKQEQAQDRKSNR